MTIEIKREPESLIIDIFGRIDTTTAPSLEKSINDNLGDAKNLILDFKCVDYISSAGLRILLASEKKMQKIGSMKLVNVSELVMEVLEVTGFADIWVIE